MLLSYATLFADMASIHMISVCYIRCIIASIEYIDDKKLNYSSLLLPKRMLPNTKDLFEALNQLLNIKTLKKNFACKLWGSKSVFDDKQNDDKT